MCMHACSGDLPNPGIKPASPELQLDYSPLHRLKLQKSTCLLTPQNDSLRKKWPKNGLGGGYPFTGRKLADVVSSY